MELPIIIMIVVAIWVAIMGAIIIIFNFRRRNRIDQQLKEAQEARRRARTLANGDIEMMAGLRPPPNIHGQRAHPIPRPTQKVHREPRVPAPPTVIEPPADPRAYGMPPTGGRAPARSVKKGPKNRPADIHIPPRW